MNTAWDRLTVMLQRGGRRMIELLRPSMAHCRMCGKSVVQTSIRSETIKKRMQLQAFSQAALLCGCCLSSIPWIENIRCFACGRAIRCDDCSRRRDAALVWNRSAVRYDPLMRSWLALYKYRGQESLAPLLAGMLYPAFEQMSEELYRQISQQPNGKGSASRSGQASFPYPELWDAVTYVPLSDARAQERGFNQAEQLAEGISRRYRIPLIGLLDRTRDTQKQSFKSRAERLKDTQTLFVPAAGAEERLTEIGRVKQQNSRNSLWRRMTSFEPHPGPSPKKTLRILLVDDIYTTGSTIHSCARVVSGITPVPVELYSLTWARS